MKKWKKIGFVALISTVLISLFAVLTFADESVTSHDSCLEEHFDWYEDSNLFPENVIGSCPYITMSLMLSYYDAYWHDDFVPDRYKTPGNITTSGEIEPDFHLNVENDEWAAIKENANIEDGSDEERIAYNNFIDSIISDPNSEEARYLHFYLISLGMDMGYHPFRLAYGLVNAQMVAVLENYLQNVCHFTESQVSVHCLSELNASQDEIFAKAKEQIEKGYPVMYTGAQVDVQNQENESNITFDPGAHVLLGYKLTDSGNDIVLSYNWNGFDETTTFYTTEFKYISGIIWLEINEDALPHECSVSYTRNDGEETYSYCTCNIYSDHPNHECKISDNQQEPCPNNQRIANCLCGQEVGSHYYYLRRYSDSSHWYECSCGDKENVEMHNLQSVYSSGTSTHHYYCDCGYMTETHSINTYGQYSLIDHGFEMRDSFHRALCECGYEKQLPHRFEFYKFGQWICKDCGYTRLNPGSGGNIIMGKKEDEETE